MKFGLVYEEIEALTRIYSQNRYSSDKISDINNEHNHFYTHNQVQSHKYVLAIDYNELEKKTN